MQTPHGQRKYKLQLVAPSWSNLQNRAGLNHDADLAKALGMSRQTVTRVLGGAEPSPQFIAHALRLFPFASFDKLFRVAEVTR